VNKDLYGKEYSIPSQTIDHLKKFEANETVNNILSSGKASYSLLKKMKHRMENGEKDTLGGDHMLGWINQTLGSDRGALDLSKDAKSESGISNTHIKTHEKNNLSNLNRPSKSHSDHNEDIKITESIIRINQLINKIN
jgi:hypothetical protein